MHGEGGLGWIKGGDDLFPFSAPFFEFPCQSSAAVSQPRINLKGRLGTTQKCRGNNLVPRPFPTQKIGLGTRSIEFCKVDHTKWKLTLQDINTTLKEPKTERGCSRRQLFRHSCGSSVQRNNREASYKGRHQGNFKSQSVSSLRYRNAYLTQNPDTFPYWTVTGCYFD